VLVVASIGAALALNSNSGSSLQVLPPAAPGHPAAKTTSAKQPAPRPSVAGEGGDVTRIVHPDLSHRGPLAAGETHGTGSLAGPPAVVLRRFATLWANRSSAPGFKEQHELVGLSGGAWANQAVQQIANSLPAIPLIHSEGSLVVFKLKSSGPGTKTAVVVTKERFIGPADQESPYRYTIYLAHLDWLDSNGYVVTGWEQQT
jgi:hypothetical protein